MTTTQNPDNWSNPNCSSPEERERAAQLYADGWNINQIAIEIGRSHSTVWNWFNRTTDDYRINEWKGKSNPKEREEAVSAYKRLGSITAVCRELDRSYDTIRRWLHSAGIDTKPKPPAPKTTTKKGADATLQKRVEELELENEKLRAVIQQLATL